MNNNKKFNNTNHKPRILVTPLNWGLGHSTRCIPVIKLLLRSDCEVFIATEGGALHLLKDQYPDLNFFTAPSYNIIYSRSKFFFKFRMMFQSLKIIRRIRAENTWLQNFITEHNINGVISDNRFGMHHPEIPCVYITHQLFIKTGFWLTDKILQSFHYSIIKKFSRCWVPDADNNGLAGELSHTSNLPENVQFIGPVSRFESQEVEKKYDIICILSGPEPQRTIFENIILSQVQSIQKTVMIIRGLPDQTELPEVHNSNVCIKNYSPAPELNMLIEASEWVISRAGYTSIMDLAKLKKKAILIPTPGQTEQEYLAKYLMSEEMFYSVAQIKFDLIRDLEKAADFPYRFKDVKFDNYVQVVNDFVVSLRSQKVAN